MFFGLGELQARRDDAAALYGTSSARTLVLVLGTPGCEFSTILKLAATQFVHTDC